MKRKWTLLNGWQPPVRVQWESSDGRRIVIVEEAEGFRVVPSFSDEVQCDSFSQAIDVAYRLQDAD